MLLRLVVSLVGLLFVLPPQQRANAPTFPGVSWERIADLRALGFCQDRLDLATAKARTLSTTAATAIVGGRVLWDYGDQAAVSYLASVRKSILAMMYGKYVANGTIALDATMKDLQITDVGGLLPAELEATVLDLLSARSGVYHDAANAACTGCGSTDGDPPGPRGSVKHGTYFLYNNWDFNALGTIFEQRTGQNIYDAFQRDLAEPLQFQDFSREAQRKTNNPRASIHPAYHFYLSTRDMARVGYLMLREGRWNGRTLVPQDWARRIVTTFTHLPDMHPLKHRQGPFGYAMLWWPWDGPFETGIYKGAYTGIGAIGQFITVLPALDMVIAHKTSQNSTRPVTRPEFLDLVDTIAGARCGR